MYLEEFVNYKNQLGDDLLGAELRRSCEALGMDLSMALTVPGARSSIYLYVTDAEGDMRFGVSDMAVTEKLTPSYLAPLLPRPRGHSRFRRFG